jgi:ankyrin repeat protein
MKSTVALAAALLVGAGSASADPLLDAVRSGSDQDAARLIEAGADVNAADSLGTTPLMWAARYGDAVLVQRLIQAGANAAAENVFGVTPMSEAALIGSEPVIRRWQSSPRARWTNGRPTTPASPR